MNCALVTDPQFQLVYFLHSIASLKTDTYTNGDPRLGSGQQGLEQHEIFPRKLLSLSFKVSVCTHWYGHGATTTTHHITTVVANNACPILFLSAYADDVSYFLTVGRDKPRAPIKFDAGPGKPSCDA